MSKHAVFRKQASYCLRNADAFAVRQGLENLFAQEPLRCLPEELRSCAELVMAEALNNVVEHAYAGGEGAIDISVEFGPDGLNCTIADYGAPMPGDGMPQGKPMDAQEISALPEGGFGWYIIRSLAQDLRYSRFQGQNFLHFRLPTPSLVA